MSTSEMFVSQPNIVNELRRLNDLELQTIIAALEAFAEDKKSRSVWSARAMLEDDAAFVRGLFWTSKGAL